jgi:hypothetical protein
MVKCPILKPALYYGIFYTNIDPFEEEKTIMDPVK